LAAVCAGGLVATVAAVVMNAASDVDTQTSATRPGPPNLAGPCGGTSRRRSGYRWGLIDREVVQLAEQRAAGVTLRLASLSWRRFYPAQGTRDEAYIERRRQEFAAMRAAGFKLVLSLGFHDSPEWVHLAYPDSRYVNQWGEPYDEPGAHDAGDANLVFNSNLRMLVDGYIRDVLEEFGSDFFAIRLGGGRYGELTYPPAEFAGRDNNYWAYDRNAARTNPVPDWRPGNASTEDEAEPFLDWYHQQLVDYELWQIRTLRRYWGGEIMMLFPSWGIRPGQAAAAASAGLSGRTPAEANGEIQRGYDFRRQVAAIDDRNVIVTTTWLEAGRWDPDGDCSNDAARWTPVHYLARLAARHPLRLRVFGENGGRDSSDDMRFAARQMRRYGLLGMLWYSGSEMRSGRFASLEDYRELIRSLGG
jgi:hypothetical protein